MLLATFTICLYFNIIRILTVFADIFAYNCPKLRLCSCAVAPSVTFFRDERRGIYNDYDKMYEYGHRLVYMCVVLMYADVLVFYVKMFKSKFLMLKYIIIICLRRRIN